MSKIIVENVKLLHIDKLKDKQTDIIPSIVQWNDTFVSLPTGYGKSVIYGYVFKGSCPLQTRYWYDVIYIGTYLMHLDNLSCSKYIEFGFQF